MDGVRDQALSGDRSDTGGGRSVRIVHVVPQDGIGGVEVAARSMLRVDAPGVDYTLLLIAGEPRRDEARIVVGASAGLNDPRAHFGALRAIRSLRPDVLICSLWRSVLVCVLAKWRDPRIKLVFFLHVDRPVHVVDRLFTRLGLTAADEIWADSDETLVARPLPAGVPTRVVSFVTARMAPSAPMPPISPRFVCWARITPQKGFDRAIALIGLLVARGIDARYDIHGPDGGAQVELERQVEAAGLADRIRFLGPLEHGQLPNVAARNSFFLQLSRFEGLGMSVVEAMQLGLVPVTTPAGQIARYVDADTGVRVDAADLSVAAARIEALLGDPEGYGRLRDAAMAYWRAAPLYRDDVVAYARSAIGQG